MIIYTELKANEKSSEVTSDTTAIEKTRNDDKKLGKKASDEKAKPSKKASSEAEKPTKKRKTSELKYNL